MATATTSAPQHGVPMPALDVRRLVGHFLTAEGIRDAADFTVTQRAAGANMTVDVAAGEAYITDDHASGGGYYHAVWTTGETGVTIGAADGSLPRVDRVILRIRDQFLGDADNTIAFVVLPGTPTAGATLANLNGAQGVPGSSLLLANVLIVALDTSITNAEIDTGPSATIRPSFRLGGSSTGQEIVTVTFTSAVSVTATSVGTANTVVTSGAVTYDASPIWVEFFSPNVLKGTNFVALELLDVATDLGEIALVRASDRVPVLARFKVTPTAGSHTYLVKAYVDAGTGSVGAGAGGAATAVPGYIRVTRV